MEVIPVITEVRIYPEKDGTCRIPEEYHSDVTYGAGIRAAAVALYSEGVMSNSRIAGFLNGITDGESGLSEGSVYGFCRTFARETESEFRHLQERLLDQPGCGNGRNCSDSE